jgi:DNA-directed RNA polymerase subunit RPC12/RpoP
MNESVYTCPSCGANLKVSRFARDATCPFCASHVVVDPSVVSVARFREARAAWEAGAAREAGGGSVQVGDSTWTLGARIATGDVTDVYAATRARWPSEAAVVRLLRRPADIAHLDRAWAVLDRLRGSPAGLLGRVPEPITRGVPVGGPYAGRAVLVARWAHGYATDLERLGPGRVSPRSAVWLWRRILEALTFLHREGVCHGQVRPAHVLVETGEHGARLVGFGGASASPLALGVDLQDSARTVIFALGGDGGRVPAAVPPGLARVLRDVSVHGRTAHGEADAWAIRERLGEVARHDFGPPAYCPIVPRP